MSCREGRVDPEIRSALCRALQSWLEAFAYHTEMHFRYTFYGPWIESFQDSWWDPEFPQLLQMVQSFPGFLNLSLNVCCPCQVLGDVYTEVLEATCAIMHISQIIYEHIKSLSPPKNKILACATAEFMTFLNTIINNNNLIHWYYIVQKCL